MHDKSFSEKFQSILESSFSEINEMKRAYLILSETSSESTKEKHENILLKSMLSLELNVRKLQKINSALSYQEQDLVSERKESYRSNGNPQLKSV
ncbi:hypothetical protein [Lederbergia citri]|uniref:Uncharacterized protein n=1 Tax=Lederbergia citri TaxID=2833580 RepID=A0A942TAV8_9BACI|nr:hypothetical protein [Lederbergia citri]MBS4194350.1 hypothetical protein [Lederbergia citri]